MRLSDAIALGRVLLKPMRGLYMSDDEENGCALGMAAKAVGIRSYECHSTRLFETWPWLGRPDSNHQMYISHITRTFDDLVCKGKISLDELIDWVRSVEPAEPPTPSLTEGANSLADARTERVAGEAKGVGV